MPEQACTGWDISRFGNGCEDKPSEFSGTLTMFFHLLYLLIHFRGAQTLLIIG